MWYRRNPALIAYALIVIAGFSAILWQNYLGDQRKEQICYAEIEDRLLWKDTLAYLNAPGGAQVDPESLPENIQKLLKDSQRRSDEFYKFMQARVEIPPTICDSTHVTEDRVRRDQIRRGQRIDPSKTTTTTTEVR